MTIRKIFRIFRLGRKVTTCILLVAMAAFGYHKLSPGTSDPDLLDLASEIKPKKDPVSYDSRPYSQEFALTMPATRDEETIIFRKSYVVSYNATTRCPDWVAWKLTDEHTYGSVPRSSKFFEDESVNTPRATLDDYRHSGWDRGHMCPAGDNKWDREAMNETFLLTNICPQNTELNCGYWNQLEQDCRLWARRYDALYICCGPIYFRRSHQTIGPNRVVVPEAFFKVILRTGSHPAAFGVVCRNTSSQDSRDIYFGTVDDVERITGYDFFAALPDDIEEKVESYADKKEWKR